MAIDSRNKRASCLSIGLAIARVLANPDGSLANVNDRQHLAYLYSGIDVGAAASLEPLCLHFTPVAVRSLTITPAKVRALTVTPVAIRSITIEPEEC